MEGFCRGCLIKYDEPMELLQYTEKNRRLFVYSTGLQVKRNDIFTFQLCKDCFLNMKQACKFKKNCRTSDKRFRNYIALKDEGDPVDFCTFLKNSDDTVTFRLPMASGNNTPATQKCRDDDNESTCTSIHNFMTDILQGEEMPDTEAQIIKEVIEEEADVLDDSLDSHWLQDDMSIDTDFRLDLSQFSTPRTVNDDRCYTPKQSQDQLTFDTINTEKQTKILNDFTNAFKSDENIEELNIFVGGIEKTESFKNLKEFTRPLGIDEIDGLGKSEIDTLKSKQNLKELISDLDIEEIDGMDTSDSQTVETNENLKEACDFGLEDINTIHQRENNKYLKELCNFDRDNIDGNREMVIKKNKSLKELISNDVEEIEGKGKSDSNDPKSNRNLNELCNFSLDCFSGAEKAENKILNNVKSLRELCDFSLDSIEDTVKSGSDTFNKNNENVKDLCDLSLNDFDDIANSGRLKNDRDVKEICDFGIDAFNKSESNLDLPSLSDVLERDNIGTPDFDIPQGVIGSIQSNNDVSNSSVNIEALLKGNPGKERIDTPDFDIPKGVIGSIQSNDDVSNSSIYIETLLKGKPGKERIDTQDFIIPKSVIGSIQSNDDVSNSSINIEALLKVKPGKERIDTPDFDIPKGVISSVQSNDDVSNSSINIEALLKVKPGKERIDTPDFDIPKGVVSSIQSNDDVSNSSINIEALLKVKPGKERIDTPDFVIPKGVSGSIQSNDDVSNSSINIEALLKDKSCSIDKNLEEALKNSDNKKISLEDLLISPPVFPAISAASTPTITNILFGENLDSIDTNTKIKQCIESYHDVQGDIEIFEEFFQNDTKEFDLEDIIRENGEFKSGDWKKHIAVNALEVANKGNDSENIEMDISFDDKNQTNTKHATGVIKKSKTEPLIHISHDDVNDKFNIEFLYCKLCKIRYDTSRAFSTHFAKKHNIKIVKPRKPSRKKDKHVVKKIEMEATINIYDTPANEKFDLENSYCKLCSKKYDTNRALSIHFAKTHRIKIEKPKCVKIYKNHELLCNNCGNKSRDHANFAKHVKKCRQRDMIFECDRCQLEFSTQSHLEKHKTCHTQIKKKKDTGKEFVCTICGKILHKQINFVLHMRRHTKDYSVKCEYCDRGFYRQADLKTHLRTHTGETPFSCKFCPKLFTRKDVLLRHVLIHLDERLFQCDYCSKKFLKKSDLIRHINNESCRRVKKLRKKHKTENEIHIDIPEEREENVEVIKENIKEEVVKDVIIVRYAKGSDAAIKRQLPFLETERSN